MPSLLALASLVVLGAGTSPASHAPATGREALEAMRRAYGGKWYSTLTFVQKTTRKDAQGKDTVETWFESLRYTAGRGTELRIDRGSPSEGNGVLYTARRTRVFRAGALSADRAGGNALLPLIEGVYLQPVATTIDELAPTGVDWSRPVVPGRWEERPVWILGASSKDDSHSPQVWVDVERKVVVRALLVPVPGAPFMDVRIERFVSLGGGWLGTRCEFLVGGKVDQLEDYEDWKAGVDLSLALFEPATFRTAKHWAAGLSTGAGKDGG
jgi:hypothetical protein